MKIPFTAFTRNPSYMGMIRLALILVTAIPLTAPTLAFSSVTHHLDIRIDPEGHELTGRDLIKIVSPGVGHLKLRLSSRLDIDFIEVNQKPRQVKFKNGWIVVPLGPNESNQTVTIEMGYRGKFNDPVPINPINTDNPGYGVSGSISNRGCLLLAGAGWYPQIEEEDSVYELKITAPAGWLAVTAGRLRGHRTEAGKSISEWISSKPVEGLALSVAPFKITTKTSGGLKAATYLLTDDPKLAERYLDATLEYLKLYSRLFGPYAFDQFTVVENFFPTGYGFPGYTLLGSRVLRLPFIIRTSLGHEIAHCWWGNGVTVDFSQGNWSEGLTTYLADYLFAERRSSEEALAYRRQMLRNYSTLVTKKSEFSLTEFYGRNSTLTKAIGYDKSAMVFHMLRHQIGEQAFWEGLRDIYRQRLFKETAWSDLQAIFEQQANKSLAYFFNQWLVRKGAPQFHLLDVEVRRPSPNNPWVIQGSIQQTGELYAFPVTLRVHIADRQFDHSIQVHGQLTNFNVTAAELPHRVELDPEVNLFRRLDRNEIPVTVNSLKGGDQVTLVVTGDSPNADHVAKTLAASLGYSNVNTLSLDRLENNSLPPNDILVVGSPPLKGPLAKVVARNVKTPSTIQLKDEHYNQPEDVFFGVFKHPDAPNRAIGFFWPLDRKGEAAARKITHYGKYSYLIFRQARNIVKGTWPIENSPIVYRW